MTVRVAGALNRVLVADKPVRIVSAGQVLYAPYSIEFARDGGYFTFNSRSSWALTLTDDGTKQVGDLILIVMSVDGGRTISSSTPGFTRLYHLATDPALAVFAHYWDGSAKTFDVSWGATEDMVATIVYLRDATRSISDIRVGPMAAGSTTPVVDLPPFSPPGGANEYMWVVALASTSVPLDADNVPPGWGGYTASTGTSASDAGLGLLVRKERTATMDVPSFRLDGTTPSWRAVLLAIPPRTS